MKVNKYTQFGTFLIVILGAVTLIVAIILFRSVKSPGPEFPVLLAVFIILLVCELLFCRLTITVDQTKIAFRMGIGIIGKEYKISDIQSCVPVKNSFLMGIGIHWIGNGWLYNVSGFKAIELKFNNKKSVVRIGTNRPEEISALINSLTGKNNVYEPDITKKESAITPLRILLVIAALFITGLIIYQNGETKYNIENNNFIIPGGYGMTIPFDKIAGIDTISDLPSISAKIHGYDDFWTKKGDFKLAGQGEVKLFVKRGHSPYLRIWIKDAVPVYINFRDRHKTIVLYRDLLKSFEK